MKKLSVIFVLLFSIFFFNLPHSEAASSQLLIINKKTNTLAFYDNGKLVKTFRVATGRSRDLTPEGKFRIVTKIKNRPYYKGGIPGGDPRNPLGDRWMGLEARGTYGTTYGIHGNNNESSIGKYVSSGCVRMHNEEVRWLYEQVQLYTTVIITYSSSSFDAIAKANGYSATTNGWVLNGGKWYYYLNGTAKTGWLSQGSTWYYFDGSGVMKTGWVLTNGKWYYLDKSGAMKTGWVYTGGKWYYLDSSGAMKTGWLQEKNNRYYLSNSGAMVTGWLKDGAVWYYLQNSGAMRTGWMLDKGKWYYLETSGAMKTGWLEINGSKYFLNSDGVMGIGWKEIEGKWYYFNTSGSMAANTVINGYKLGADGSWIQVEYVALGDSLAAGMTPLGEDKKPVNGVDPNWGYPNYIAEKFAKTYQLIDFVNYGVSGYKTDDVIADLGKAEVQKEIKEATHVTIDIGANDLLPVIQTKPADAPATIATIAAKLNGILSTIDALNPKVKVYVMGYYNPFPYVTDVQQKAQFEQLLTAMNGQIQAQAVKNGDTFVPTAQVINTANFTEYLPNPQNIHLSVTGYQVVAGEFWKVMQ
ncbi:L,D-transpeptidase family protein [Neobacillus sp. PS2-9]|uniref:L,D-transpeptidase family protein n=1 Tax=Neobacillus sp. PS2-9 TaxID=3070676 RepID=UPI0027E12F7F|nr:L,D-transpeptidase family protein [Neobacillus sp. PS2-9]WML58313.1 L,D-transpeptidase family protein [Neobacillus sp. PS2-9]